jgi:hypothetical protein
MIRFITVATMLVAVFQTTHAYGLNETEKKALYECRCQDIESACEKFQDTSLVHKYLYSTHYVSSTCKPFYTEAFLNKSILLNVFHPDYTLMLETLAESELITEIEENAIKENTTTRTRAILNPTIPNALQQTHQLLQETL